MGPRVRRLRRPVLVALAAACADRALSDTLPTMADDAFHELDPNALREAIKPRTPPHSTLKLMQNGTLRVATRRGQRLDLRRNAGLWRYDTRHGHSIVETGIVEGLDGFDRLAKGLDS